MIMSFFFFFTLVDQVFLNLAGGRAEELVKMISESQK